MKKYVLFFAIAALAAGLALAITQTGNLIVTVTSEEGQILPGATVVVRSDVLMGTRTQITAANGKAAFRNLPPGSYAVEVNMDGFQPMIEEGIDVRLGKTAKAEIRLKIGETKEVVTVAGTAPIIDTTSNTVSSEFDFDQFINHMPTGRHYNGVASLAPGVEAGNNPSVFGSGSQDNYYLVDGSNSTDSRSETWGSWVMVDTVADMSMMTAGLPAEYGHSVGSVMNVVLKSGSNEITGMARLELRRTLWNDITFSNPDFTSDDVRLGQDENNWHISGGGPIYPDVLWWYVGYSIFDQVTAYNRFLNPMNDQQSTPAVMVRDGHILHIKGTAMIAESLKLQYLYKEDPMNIHNVMSGRTDYLGPYCLPSADQIQVEAGDTMLANLSFVVSESAFIEGRWARDRLRLDVVAQEADPDGRWTTSQTTGPFFASNDGWFWGSVIQTYESDRNSDTYAGSFSYLLQTESLGEHDIKVGVEYLEHWGPVLYTLYPGDEYILTGDLTGVGYDDVPYLYRYTYENRLPEASTTYKDWTFYIQDSISLGDNLTVNLGVRTDIAAIYNNNDVEIHKDGLFTALAPRAGFAYDLSGIVLRGSFGRYYDLYNLYLADTFNTFPVPETTTYWESTDGTNHADPGWVEMDSWTAGDPVCPHTFAEDASPNFSDEITIGFDYLFSDALAISVTGVYRDYQGVIVPYDTDWDRVYNFDNIETTEYGDSWKRFWGATFDIKKRPVGDNLFLNFNLNYQYLEGFRIDDNQAVYYANPLQTDADTANWWGELSSDRSQTGFNWWAKAQGTYFFQNNWYLGVQAVWVDGIKESTTERVELEGGSVTIYPNGKEDMERLPAALIVNVQFGIEQPVEFPFDVPLWDDNLLIGVYANIYNLFDNQSEDRVQINIASSSYGEPIRWRTGRNYQLGFRIEF